MENYYNDDFTKKIIINYSREFFKNEFPKNRFFKTDSYDCFIDKIIETLSLNSSLSEYFDRISTNTAKYKPFANKMLKEINQKSNLISRRQTTLEKKFKIIRKIYDLDKIEYEYVVFYSMKELSECIDSFYNVISTYNRFSSFGHLVLNLPSWCIQAKKTSLLKKGIIINCPIESDVKVKAKILEIMANPEIKTEAQIRSTLLGKKQKSDLKWKDFEYLQKERDIALNILSSAVKDKIKGINILFYGSVGSGKTQLAKLIANKANIEQYAIITRIDTKEANRADRLNDLVSKQAILSSSRNSCILFDEAEDVMNSGFGILGSASKGYLTSILEETPVPVIWTTNNISEVDPAFLRRMTYTIEFENLSEDIRLNIWKQTLKKNRFKVEHKKLINLNKSYEIPPSIITNAVNTTKMINGTQDDFEFFVENLAQVVAKKKNIKKYSSSGDQDYDFNLINTDLGIENLTAKIKSAGKLNFSLCLYGEPGTGKSLFARHLAKELGIDVIIKRASDLMSKYVGETEQNTARAFAEARAKKAMLVFDEADSFLRARTGANYHWEVSQVNEMLTWLEAHEYPFVCTTNLIDTLDEASLRRFTFKIKFGFMKREHVINAFEYFFNIKNSDFYIEGLTAGDFATIKKKIEFLGIKEYKEICKMLSEEVKLKKTEILQNRLGF